MGLTTVTKGTCVPPVHSNDDDRSSSQSQNEELAKIKSLEAQLNAALNEIKELKEIIASLRPKETYSPANSDEEEELVARETAWLLTKHEKKKTCDITVKKQEASSVISDEEEALVAEETAWIVQKSKKRKHSESPKANYNKSTSQIVEQPGSKMRRPPPVVVSEVKDYNQLKTVLKNKNINFKTSMLNNNQIKINVENELDYRILTKTMNECNHQWHTYENKQTRPIRVMVRNLHHTCKEEDIKQDLLDKGFKIIDVVNKIKKVKENNVEKKIPLPMFMLTFETNENIKKIYSIEFICHMKVKIEAIRSSKLIPQCRRCQRFGHTQKFCGRETKCVKCAGNHLTADCSKPGNIKPKCSNCGENHPANYRGCVVAKELQKRRELANKAKKSPQENKTREFNS